MGAPLADAERVTVGQRAGDAGDADRAIGAADVLDDDRLTQRFAHGCRHDAAERIGRAAGWKRNDHGDWPRRKFLRGERQRRAERHAAGEPNDNHDWASHMLTSRLFLPLFVAMEHVDLRRALYSQLAAKPL